MRLGVLLPTFRPSPDDALAVARAAHAAGLDGVFAYDHVWPMGSPDRPALAPFEVLATIAPRAPALSVGMLVARVGLVPGDVLAAQFRALQVVARGGVVAGIGTGDRLSAAENLAYGVPVASPSARRDMLRGLARQLRDEAMEVWIGDGSAPTRQIAAEVGCTLNLWEATPGAVGEAARTATVSWGGTAPRAEGLVDEPGLRALLAALSDAGATWAVLAPGVPPDVLERCRPAR